ncbi:Protein kinase domain [Sesbania bispinosa]|nr:Protein kinase domain [Sesbania bispinosa]
MKNSLIIAFSITICFIAFVISKIFISVLLYKRWRRKQLIYEDGFTGGKMVIFRSSVLKSLTSDMVLKKTQKLNNKDIIGSGGYGVVYELKLDDSTAFAVKRLNRGTAERDKGFERELEAMADIKHRNIVTLHGYYSAPHYNLLIYELMPNGSLDSVLHGSYLLSHRVVKAVVREKKEELVLDSSLGSCPMQEVNKVFNIAMMCLEPDPLKRPTMAEVVNLLEQTESNQLVTAS